MYIRISEIPREGLDVFASRGRSWIPRMLEGMDPSPLQGCRLVAAELVLTLEGRNIFADGSFTAEGVAVCDRCAEAIRVALEKDFHTVLVPGENGPAGSSNLELHEADLDIGFYYGAGVEVKDVLWEQVALALPVKLLCSEECNGICPECGGNRNRGECGCPGTRAPGPFDILRKPKEEKE
ncbi:MAG: DUF177 domain-containing protein [Deltaproteobacteria bacterium]|nr:DUF177 domain-containing protein [Deltaproteobacteria bacterium]